MFVGRVEMVDPSTSKAIQNGRVVLVPGDTNQVAIVQEVFLLFVEKGFNERQIAGHLNARNVPSPGGVRWSEATDRHIPATEADAGLQVRV